MEELLYGRELLLSEIPTQLHTKIMHQTIPLAISETTYEKRGQSICKRCNQPMTKVGAEYCICQKSCAYCRHCLKMGKVRKCAKLYFMPETNQFHLKEQKLLKWTGTLSEQQKMASKAIQETILRKERHLLWAVTGAGKTEMLFSGIEKALQNKERVCVASPRVDVCLELAPRFAQAFPHTSQAVLFGEMKKPYAYTQLVIATTHQLLRFREAFDVLIIDEIDAFPFTEETSLQFAAEKARKKESALIYLSATPSKQMQKEVAVQQLKATILPARYHGHKLPVPVAKWCVNWRKQLLKRPLKTTAGRHMDQLIQQNKRFLVFVPNIKWMQQLEKVLRKTYPTVSFTSVSAEDSKRKEKVMGMRKKEYQFLITSTILERGVTFPNIDVLVIGAEDRVFTESALVQIAGRAGRSPEYPTGNVVFYHDGQSLAIKRAIRQIRKMNELAAKRGLVK